MIYSDEKLWLLSFKEIRVRHEDLESLESIIRTHKVLDQPDKAILSSSQEVLSLVTVDPVKVIVESL